MHGHECSHKTLIAYARSYAVCYTVNFQIEFAKRAESIIKYQPSGRPFFLYVPFQSVHIPLQVGDVNVPVRAHPTTGL